MREATYGAITALDPDELLTTGEAAELLNSSRQHIVDLCDRGELPFTTVGSHRRVRRGDVEAIRTRTDRLTRDQRRSLWLAYATAGRIVEDPEHARSIARRNLSKMRPSARGQARRWLEEWDRLLDGPVDRLLDVMTSRSPRGRELRQNAPFAGLLQPHERERVLASWRVSDTK
jgi:excisionase family DNA binding protein